jgi:two-component system response regulator HydG
VIKIFHHYNWPGNLRELNNVIKRSTLLTSGDYVEVSALPFEITHYDKLNFEISDPPPSENPVKQQIPASTEPVKKNMPLNDYGMKHASIDAEFELIVEALKKCNYNKSKAAQMLNIDRKTLYNKMKQYKEFNGNL